MQKTLIFFILLYSTVIQAQKSDFSNINFSNADQIARNNTGETLENLPLLAYKLTNQLNSDIEKFRAIYIWVCSNIESDYSFGELTLRKRRKFKNDNKSFLEWNKQMQSKVFERLLRDQKTICTGYAYLVKELANLVDIECEIINGYSRTTKRNVGTIDIPNHSWNAVKLDNKWYQVDATLASGYFDVSAYKFVKDYNDGYFLADPELYLTKYFPLDPKWLLADRKSNLNEFVSAPVTYGSTFKHNIIPLLPKTLKTNSSINDDVIFRFKIPDSRIVADMRIIYSSGLKGGTIQLDRSNYSDGYVVLKHRFKKKGNYDVHVMVNKAIIASYNVKVKNEESQ